jgi:hypothetical protein
MKQLKVINNNVCLPHSYIALLLLILIGNTSRMDFQVPDYMGNVESETLLECEEFNLLGYNSM